MPILAPKSDRNIKTMEIYIRTRSADINGVTDNLNLHYHGGEKVLMLIRKVVVFS